LQGISLKMRVGGLSNATLRNRWEANCEDRFAWHKNALKPYFFTVFFKPLVKLEQFQMMYRILRIFKQKAYHTVNLPIPSTSSPILEERSAGLELVR
jgi:hypothetical protein